MISLRVGLARVGAVPGHPSCPWLLPVIFLPALLGQQTTEQDVKALATTTNQGNTHLSRALSLQAKADFGEKYRSVVQSATSGEPTASTLNSIAREAVRAQQQYNVGYAVLKGNDLLLEGAIGAGIALAPATGGLSLAVSAIGKGASVGLKQVEDLYKGAAQESIRRNLKTRLDQYQSTYGPDAYAKLASSKDPTQFRSELESKAGSIFGSELDGLPPDKQDIVNHFYERQIVDLMKGGFSGLSNVVSLQQGEIDQNRKDIKGLALSFSEFADSTTNQLQSIFKAQQELAGSLQTFNDRLGRTEEGVAFMQSVMFSNMKPAEQLAALKSGVFPDMPSNDRKALEEKIAIVAKRQEITYKVATYLAGASDLTNIAKNLGVDPKIVNAANSAINIGNQALNAFTAISSGNYLSAISSVSNILGVGGPDVAAERHEEIMNMLGEMYTKLDVIDGKLASLRETQKLIIQTQQQILENIAQLSQQVQQNQYQLLTELHDIHADVLVNRQITVDQARVHYGNCYLLVHSLDGSRIIDTSIGKYPSWGQFQRFYPSVREDLQKCTGQLSDTRGGDQDFQSVFWLVSYQDAPESNVEPYLRKVFRPAWELLKADGRSIDQLVSSLLAPMGTVQQLRSKQSNFATVNPPRFRKTIASLMEKPLAPSAVILHDSLLADIHYYYMLLDDDGKPRLLSDLYKAEKIRETGYYRLIEALNLTDIAIAQQTLVSGDSLLPVLASVIDYHRDVLESGVKDMQWEKEKYEKTMALLRSDAVLATNFITYKFRSEVQRKCGFAAYSIALTFPGVAGLRQCTDKGWEFHFSEQEKKEGHVVRTQKGWSVDFGGASYPLPTAEHLLEGKFVYGDELYELLRWRERLLQEAATYEVFHRVNRTKVPAINNVILGQFTSVSVFPLM
jgi:hypothetical protein